MRLVQATVPSDVRQDVKDALDNHDIDAFATDETSTDEYEEVPYFFVPEEQTENVRQDLDAGGRGGDDHVVITQHGGGPLQPHRQTAGQRGRPRAHRGRGTRGPPPRLPEWSATGRPCSTRPNEWSARSRDHRAGATRNCTVGETIVSRSASRAMSP